MKKLDKDELHAKLGSLGYEAPEMLLNQPYSKPVDIWSVGVVFFMLILGYPPFDDDDPKVIHEAIKRGV